jgi:hypothetical protein
VSGRQQQGWHWPFSRNTVDEAETEIVYVTDTADADEIIEEPDYVQDVEIGEHEQQEAAGGAYDPTTAAEQAAADMEDVAAPSSSTQQFGLQRRQEAPEATATVSASSHPHHQQQHLQDTLTSPTSSLVVSQHPAFASTSLAAPASSSYWATSAGGWVVALSLLFAVRQGRQHADAARLDVRALQSRQQESRVQVGYRAHGGPWVIWAEGPDMGCSAKGAVDADTYMCATFCLHIAGMRHSSRLLTSRQLLWLTCHLRKDILSTVRTLCCLSTQRYAKCLLIAAEVVCLLMCLQSRELKEKRALYLQQQTLLKEEAAAKR